jgi:NAD(P)-dependent dehydrogenase (short-subunit alcohol dehydrogenase family)
MVTTQLPVAQVTGGARRIGAVIVRDLADAGFSVAIHCNSSRTEADALAAELTRAGRRVCVVQADLSDMEAVADLIPTVAATLGPVGILINNASIFNEDTADSFEWETWDKHFDVHLKAPVLLGQKLLAGLPQEAGGLIVNIIDQRVWRPTPRFFSYTLSKSALWTATRTMAQSFAPRVRVNAIGPGPTLMNQRQDPVDFQKQVDALLLKRGPGLGEFAQTIRFLWEAQSVTGQMIALDGGQHLAWKTPDVYGVVE